MGQKKVSLLVRCPIFSEVEMHARVVLEVGKGVLFREVSSVQAYRFHCIRITHIHTHTHMQ